jgi:hypothetical protein
MASVGRPRLTPEVLQDRVQAYCSRYGVEPQPEGLPPFPAGRRETPQHREWLALYKAQQRLGRRSRGQCARCGRPVTEGSVFCEAHRDQQAAVAAAHGTSLAQREALRVAQKGLCPVCREEVGLWESVDVADGARRGLLHPRCLQAVGLARSLGEPGLGRLRAYAWPSKKA